MDPRVSQLLDKMEAKRLAENKKQASKPCPKPQAEQQYSFLMSWSRGRPINRFTDASCNFWVCGKRMTKIEPDEVSGMIKHGFAELKNDHSLVLK
jgi:hypothetical protein